MDASTEVVLPTGNGCSAVLAGNAGCEILVAPPPAGRRSRPSALAAPPLLKWAGGKTGELPLILDNSPPVYSRYIEPFLGGGAVFWAQDSGTRCAMNDRSASLANFYRQVARGDGDMMNILRSLSDAWESIAALMEGDLGSGLSGQYRSFGRTTPSPGKKTPTSPNVVRCWIAPISDTIRSHLAQTLPWRLDEVGPGVERAVMSKMIRMRAIEARAGVGRMGDGDLVRNLEAAIKSALYCHIRFLSNNVSAGRLDVPPGAEAAMFFFIREFAYAAMFRFNSQGGFNVPYGGMTYNRKNFRSKVERLADADLAGRLSAAILENMDFEDFLKKVAPGEGDFIFLDPPYDTEFSEYDRNAFSADDQKRLADCLLPSRAKWMVVIKDTPLIRSLYTKPGIRIRSFGKKYMWTIKQRNNRDVVHLMITNY